VVFQVVERQGPVKLTQQQLEAHLWGAAKILRGKTAGQDYKNYILSLMFYKRLCDQWEHEAEEAIAELERQQGKEFTDRQKAIFRQRGEHRFNLPDSARWGDVKAASTNIGAVLTTAMRAVASANEELRGVFTVDWNAPAPDGSGKPLIPNEVVHALVQHFDEHDLSNKNVTPDVLGRAYEFLIKQFADDAGAKAGEFFTPPAVVDALVRMLEPHPGDMVYDPTVGSGGMLVHCGDFLRESGNHATAARYFGQEMNWANAAIAKINSVLHGLEADIRAGTSTITDPQFTDDGAVQHFSLVLANFPFSDDFWWLKPEQQTDDKTRRQKLKDEVFTKEGYKDPYGRFGRGTAFHAPPPGYGDYAFILHILASLADGGRAGVVCPQGVLFRGQPEIDEETGEFDDNGDPVVRRRKADDEHLIRRSLLEAGVLDAVISLPLNIFYGAGLPACLLILRRDRAQARRSRLLMVYAGRHFRELSAQNELRPQDVMRIIVHYHAYGDATKVPELCAHYTGRILEQIKLREEDEVGRLYAEYQPFVDRMAELEQEIAIAEGVRGSATTKRARDAAERNISTFVGQREKLIAKIAERDEQVSASQLRATADRADVSSTSADLISMYDDELELVKNARVVDMDEIMENDFNLNVPRYVDTFEPEQPVGVAAALQELAQADLALQRSSEHLRDLLKEVGYAD
jgi:type I restriction enzyme M protein